MYYYYLEIGYCFIIQKKIKYCYKQCTIIIIIYKSDTVLSYKKELNIIVKYVLLLFRNRILFYHIKKN
jgi:hypothetical protein